MDDVDRIEDAARKIKAHQAMIAERTEAIGFLKDKIAELVGNEIGDYLVGNDDEGYLQATVYQSKTFNEAFGKKARPDLWEKFKESKDVLTSARAKDKLDEDEYAQFQKPSAKLSVKVEVLNENE